MSPSPNSKVQVVEEQSQALASVSLPSTAADTLTRREILSRVSKQLPYNRQGAPKGFYRPDLIPPEVAREDLADILDAAYAELSIDEGFPSFADGRPFWNRIDCEPPTAFQVFQVYLNQGDVGPRSMESLLESSEVLHYVRQALQAAEISKGLAGGFSPLLENPNDDDLSGFEADIPTLVDPAVEPSNTLADARNNLSAASAQVGQVLEVALAGASIDGGMGMLPTTIDVSSPQGLARVREQIQEWFHTYYWRERTRTYDLYRAAAYKHIRARRAMTAEGKHFEFADKVITKLQVFLDSDEFASQLDAKTAIDAFSKMVAIQRASTGLDGGGKGASGNKGATEETHDFEMVLRNIAQKNANQGSHTVDEDGRLIPSTDTLLRDVLENSDATSALQEMIIRVTSRKTSSADTPNASDIIMDEGDLRDDLGLS